MVPSQIQFQTLQMKQNDKKIIILLFLFMVFNFDLHYYVAIRTKEDMYMSKNNVKLGIAGLTAAATGAALFTAKKVSDKKKEEKKATSEYRNTERGKYEKNSKGIYYTNGNYEAFARPEKPEGVDKKSAYIIGTGLAGLSAAFYLVRDGQMKGEHIHLLEKLDLAGGSCDEEKMSLKDFICVVDVKWIITLNVCGICLEAFPL